MSCTQSDRHVLTSNSSFTKSFKLRSFWIFSSTSYRKAIMLIDTRTLWDSFSDHYQRMTFKIKSNFLSINLNIPNNQTKIWKFEKYSHQGNNEPLWDTISVSLLPWPLPHAIYNLCLFYQCKKISIFPVWNSLAKPFKFRNALKHERIPCLEVREDQSNENNWWTHNNYMNQRINGTHPPLGKLQWYYQRTFSSCYSGPREPLFCDPPHVIQ